MVQAKTLLFGFLNVHKPAGITAHDVVAAIRRTVKVKQVGHAGTLDPAATGVLPIAIGKACRLLRFLPGEKTYRAEVLLGCSTNTDDLDGEVISQAPDIVPSAEQLLEELLKFRGALVQKPPLYSAVHVKGKRLYELARKGEAPEEVPDREVTVHQLDLLSYEYPLAMLRIRCSAGTYIRSIARDMGHNLGCGGCLKSLVREQAGPFHLDQSQTLDQITSAVLNGTLDTIIVPPHEALPLVRVALDAHQCKLIRQGQPVLVEPDAMSKTSDEGMFLGSELNPNKPVAAMYDDRIVAICRASEVISSFVRIQPEVVISDGE